MEDLGVTLLLDSSKFSEQVSVKLKERDEEFIEEEVVT